MNGSSISKPFREVVGRSVVRSGYGSLHGDTVVSHGGVRVEVTPLTHLGRVSVTVSLGRHGGLTIVCGGII